MGKISRSIADYPLDDECTRRSSKPKGKPNGKNAREVKELVAEIVAGNLDQFELDMQMIKDPKERCDVMLKLMNFVLPKVSAVDVNGTMEFDSVNDEISKLARQAQATISETVTKNAPS